MKARTVRASIWLPRGIYALKRIYSTGKLRDKSRFVWLVRASSAAAHFVEQLRVAAGLDVGCLFVWLLYFGQAK